jgi:hypothetical protein
MGSYRIYCLDADGRIAVPEWLDASDDEDAIKQTQTHKNGARQCEVWQCKRLVARLGKQELVG